MLVECEVDNVGILSNDSVAEFCNKKAEQHCADHSIATVSDSDLTIVTDSFASSPQLIDTSK